MSRYQQAQDSKPSGIIALILVPLISISVSVVAQPAPTTLNDFQMPGTQPGELTDLIESVSRCDSCHGNYDIHDEPLRPWAASMMGQAMRDPIFLACMSIAEQDAAFVGDLCLRCHTPTGWLEGRSTPTDGSALIAKDIEGINCNFCHRMVDHEYQAGVSPIEDLQIHANLTIPPPFPGNASNGNFIVDDLDRRRGPFDLGSFNKHDWLESPFHADSDNCATCHDVSNPVFMHMGGGVYELDPLDTPHQTQNKYDMFPVERTYSEWENSAFADAPIEMGGRFGGNKTAVSTCQDCHMPDATGKGCKTGEDRTDLPVHHFNGGNTWMLQAVRNLFPDDRETLLEDESVADSSARAVVMLEAASDLELRQEGSQLIARVINQGGHKLPSGYPEGRRIWVNVEFKDSGDQTILEHGHYDDTTAILTYADTKVYEAKLGLDAYMSGITGVPEGPSFHFAIANKFFKDNRIPPRGFTNAAFTAIGSPPVAYSYPDGQYWDDTSYSIPPGATSAQVEVYYQLVSKEYADFLVNENVTDNTGVDFYSQYILLGRSAPIEMDSASIALTSVGACSEGDVTTTGAGIGDPGYGVPDGQITAADINYYVNAWVANDLTIADVTTTGAAIGDPGYGVPDGLVTGADIQYFVNLWVAGCP